MAVLRSLAFYLVFYAASVYFVLGSVVAMVVWPAGVRRFPDGWARAHRLCLRVLLGIEVRETGAKPPGAALYAFKHESLFEAIDLPAALDFPVPFGKEELYRIPGWGRAPRRASAAGPSRPGRDAR